MTPSNEELHAYVDGALSPERLREIEAFLADSPQAAERVSAWRAQNAALRARFASVADEPVPDRLQQAARRRRFPYAMAAGFVAAGVAMGWLAHAALLADRAPGTVSLAKRAAVAHAVYSPEVRHPVEVPAEQHDHLVGWLSKRLGTRVKAPVLDDAGYHLVGGRLLPGENGPVAQFMYQNGAGQRLTLYVSRASGSRETAFRFSQENKVSVFYWIDGTLGYALSGELPKAELLTVATSVYRQLNP